jgi:hypothetical protein
MQPDEGRCCMEFWEKIFVCTTLGLVVAVVFVNQFYVYLGFRKNKSNQIRQKL